jgi:alpha-mannosidase
LNDPIIVYERTIDDGRSTMVHAQSSMVNGPLSMVSASAPNVIIETIKQAEDGDGIILRLYESQRKRGPVQVRFGRAVEAAWITNLLEENESALSVDQDSFQLNLRPYQIVTLRVKFQ